MKDSIAAGAWMMVRVASLALWVWLLVRELPADDFGWLASVLAVSAVCTLLTPLGIPYLFFADAHVPEQRERRLRESLGVLLVAVPVMAVAGTLLVVFWLGGMVSTIAMFAFLMLDVLSGAIVQTAALWGHAVGRLGIAAGLPAMLVCSRVVAAGLCILIGNTGFSLADYLSAHAVLGVIVAVATLLWIARNTSGKWNPALPSFATFTAAWRYGVMGGTGLALSELDKPILARVMGLQYTGYYAVAYRICSILAMPATALAAALLPRWAAMVAKHDTVRLKQSFRSALVLVALVGTVLALSLKGTLMLLPPGFFDIYPDAWPWMQGLAWLGVVLGLHQVAGTALLAMGRPLVRASLDLIGLGLLVLLVVLAFPAWGAHGVILACLITEISVAATATAMFFFMLRDGLKVAGDMRDT